MKRDHKVRMILAFTVGAAVGAAVALLSAPKSGEELREDVADAFSERAREARYAGKRLKQRAQEVVELAVEPVQDAIDAGSAAYSKAKHA